MNYNTNNTDFFHEFSFFYKTCQIFGIRIFEIVGPPSARTFRYQTKDYIIATFKFIAVVVLAYINIRFHFRNLYSNLHAAQVPNIFVNSLYVVYMNAICTLLIWYRWEIIGIHYDLQRICENLKKCGAVPNYPEVKKSIAIALIGQSSGSLAFLLDYILIPNKYVLLTFELTMEIIISLLLVQYCLFLMFMKDLVEKTNNLFGNENFENEEPRLLKMLESMFCVFEFCRKVNWLYYFITIKLLVGFFDLSHGLFMFATESTAKDSYFLIALDTILWNVFNLTGVITIVYASVVAKNEVRKKTYNFIKLSGTWRKIFFLCIVYVCK